MVVHLNKIYKINTISMKNFTLTMVLSLLVLLGVQAQNLNGFYNVKSSDGYVEVKGRKTAALNLSDPAGKAGAIIKIKAENGKVTELRSQGVDPTAYAQKALRYVPEIVDLVVDKLDLAGSGSILGTEGVDKLMAKFKENIDVNLYLEEVDGGYRIYGKTPSMTPVLQFYNENKSKIDYKLPGLEQAINDAIKKITDRLGRGSSLNNSFSLATIWDRMKKAGVDIPAPTSDNVMDFYHGVFANETNIWQFAYQTATFYMEIIEEKGKFQDLMTEYSEYAKYWDLIKKIRPDFKYYIVNKGGDFDIISQGNTDIKNNAARTIWTLEEVESFDITTSITKQFNDLDYYYTTLYVDFAYDLPETAKAYYVTGIDSKGYAQTTEISGTVPAQTPVIIESEGTGDISLTPNTNNGSAISGNILRGNDYLVDLFQIKTQKVEELFNQVSSLLGGTHMLDNYEHLQLKNAGTINNKYFFDLSLDDFMDPDYGVTRTEITNGNVRAFALNPNTNKLGFYKYKKALKGNKVFLYIESSSSAGTKDNLLSFGETGIESIKAESNSNVIYDLQGRKVSSPFNGVFIINGKKVVIK